MKKILLLMVLSAMIFFGCKKEDNNSSGFDYDIKLLYGKWRTTHVELSDGSYLDVTSSIAESVFKPTYSTFNLDGTYSISGYFGNFSGTYKTEGKTIITYVSGEEDVRYDVLSLSGISAELYMYDNEDADAAINMKIKVTKQ